jgi:hypothetical protein
MIGGLEHRRVPPRMVSRPVLRRWHTVATTSRSPPGPTTSWTAVISSASVRGSGDGLPAPGLPLPSGVPARRALTVAMSYPPTMPRPAGRAAAVHPMPGDGAQDTSVV